MALHRDGPSMPYFVFEIYSQSCIFRFKNVLEYILRTKCLGLKLLDIVLLVVWWVDAACLEGNLLHPAPAPS